METQIHVVPDFPLTEGIAAVIVACAFISIMSFVKEPQRQKLNAIILAGAAGVYWSGGLGQWEFLFGTLLMIVAFKGLKNYYFIGIGWLMHTSWDIVHHLYGNPIIYLDASSSAGCAVCDPILAIWFFLGAPAIWSVFKKQKTIIQ